MPALKARRIMPALKARRGPHTMFPARHAPCCPLLPVPLLVTVLLCVCNSATPTAATPLDDYVNKPDTSFAYHKLENETQAGPGFKGAVPP